MTIALIESTVPAFIISILLGVGLQYLYNPFSSYFNWILVDDDNDNHVEDDNFINY